MENQLNSDGYVQEMIEAMPISFALLDAYEDMTEAEKAELLPQIRKRLDNNFYQYTPLKSELESKYAEENATVQVRP
jgi:hypothetical protein